jgi:tetratricopeptide (TPR) repeat protein
MKPGPTSLLLLLVIASAASATEKFYVRPKFYGDALTYLNKGVELMDKGDLHGAKNCFDAAIRIDQRIWPAYLDRAEVYAHLGQWQLALQDCDTAAHLQPKFYRTFIIRAMVYRDLGRCGDALSDLNTILSFHGGDEIDALALSRRALVRGTCRDPAVRDVKLALADAKQACELDRWKHGDYIGVLALACGLNGDFDSAVRYQRQAIERGKYKGAELRTAQERLSEFERHQH